ncbi:MAG TPA: hypothetical protein V6D17_05835 [Candidatus Obscuribacterales bacterium]
MYAEISCPFCKEKVTSGIGFRVGAIANRAYKVGDRLSWEGENIRPAKRPAGGDITSIGYFNCDNVACSSWKDCFPDVQQALVVVENDVIVKAEVYNGPSKGEEFAIIKPAPKKKGHTK